MTLVVKDVRINKDVGGKVGKKDVNAKDISEQELDFRNKKIPHFVTTFAQVINHS